MYIDHLLCLRFSEGPKGIKVNKQKTVLLKTPYSLEEEQLFKSVLRAIKKEYIECFLRTQQKILASAQKDG